MLDSEWGQWRKAACQERGETEMKSGGAPGCSPPGPRHSGPAHPRLALHLHSSAPPLLKPAWVGFCSVQPRKAEPLKVSLTGFRLLAPGLEPGPGAVLGTPSQKTPLSSHLSSIAMN